jgi:hypothetical protein
MEAPTKTKQPLLEQRRVRYQKSEVYVHHWQSAPLGVAGQKTPAIEGPRPDLAELGSASCWLRTSALLQFRASVWVRVQRYLHLEPNQAACHLRPGARLSRANVRGTYKAHGRIAGGCHSLLHGMRG